MPEQYKFIKMLKTLNGLGMIKAEFRAQQLFLKHAVELMTKRIPEHRANHVWFSWTVPPEIVHATDAVAIESDTMGAYLSTFGYAERLLSYVEQEVGIGCVCSYHKALLGAVHQELIPLPKAVIVNGNCCDSVVKLGAHLKEVFGCELLIIDTPAMRSEAARLYLKKQLMEIPKFIASVTGATWDMDRFRHAVRLSNEANDYWRRALDLRKGKPLIKGIQTIGRFFNILTTFGTPGAVEVTRMFYEELLERSQQPQADSEHLCRFMWLHNLPVYKSLFDRLEEDLGAAVVVEVMTYPHQQEISLDDPFLSLADRLLTHPIITVNEQRGDYCRNLAQEFNVDGLVQMMHMNCRGNYGHSHGIAEALKKDGIPTLFLEMDSLDTRYYAPEQLKTRVQAFMETILVHKQSVQRV